MLCRSYWECLLDYLHDGIGSHSCDRCRGQNSAVQRPDLVPVGSTRLHGLPEQQGCISCFSISLFLHSGGSMSVPTDSPQCAGSATFYE